MPEKKKVLLFTDEFPFGAGETFLEAEMKEWNKVDNVDLIIIPVLGKNQNVRFIPETSIIDTKLREILYFYQKNVFVIFPIVFFNPFFWKEIIRFPQVFLNMKKFRKLIALSVFSFIIDKYLRKNYSEILNKESTVFYSYWFYYAANAGALLKRKGYKFKLITRAHGTDIFQNRKDTGLYIPFRRFPIWKYIDKIFTVSNKGADYLKSNQKIPSSKIEVSYLGIDIPNSICKASPRNSNSIHLVSCSNLVSVKRVHLLIKAISIYHNNNPEKFIKWVHIGDGPLKPKTEQLATQYLSNTKIEYAFKGQLTNKEVYNYYKNNTIDCFVTTSENEGLPVSIMEALCFGIPVLATSVGGIPEAVDNNVGELIPKDFSQEEFTRALDRMLEFKNISIRNSIANFARDKFDAEKNFKLFIKLLLNH